MKNGVLRYLVAFVITLWIAVGLTHATFWNGTNSSIQELREKITTCQKDLPRNQKCKLIAVPDEVRN